MRTVLVAIALAASACRVAPVASRPVEATPPPAPVEPPRLTWEHVGPGEAPPSSPLPPRVWRVHLLDVGTGLSLLVEGRDFALLYDAGSNDPGERPARVLDYLAAVLRGRALDHVVLSHPHLDHASALEAVLDAHPVATLWDAGAINQAVFYRDLIAAIAREPGVAYRTAAPPADGRRLTIKGIEVAGPPRWDSFSEGDVVRLGAGARFTILHAEPEAARDLNESSLVIAVDLGAVRLLLTGDAGSGRRADPSAPPGKVEQHLLDHFAREIDADILQVGHHGSKTSSRRAFLDAVSPELALISAGPRAYRGTTLPDPEVVAALADGGATILRTDASDATCATGPGGCDSWVITIDARYAGRSRRPSAWRAKRPSSRGATGSSDGHGQPPKRVRR